MIEGIAILLAVGCLVAVVLLYAELRVVKDRLEHLRQPVREERRDEFVDEEHAWPRDINEALAQYPVELAEPTRQWIRQQRRYRVDWGVIRRRVLSNPDNALENNWEDPSGGMGQ